jgi:hypothetical protein
MERKRTGGRKGREREVRGKVLRVREGRKRERGGREKIG